MIFRIGLNKITLFKPILYQHKKSDEKNAGNE